MTYTYIAALLTSSYVRKTKFAILYAMVGLVVAIAMVNKCHLFKRRNCEIHEVPNK